jgi:hypothetical protein
MTLGLGRPGQPCDDETDRRAPRRSSSAPSARLHPRRSPSRIARTPSSAAWRCRWARWACSSSPWVRKTWPPRCWASGRRMSGHPGRRQEEAAPDRRGPGRGQPGRLRRHAGGRAGLWRCRASRAVQPQRPADRPVPPVPGRCGPQPGLGQCRRCAALPRARGGREADAPGRGAGSELWWRYEPGEQRRPRAAMSVPPHRPRRIAGRQPENSCGSPCRRPGLLSRANRLNPTVVGNRPRLRHMAAR